MSCATTGFVTCERYRATINTVEEGHETELDDGLCNVAKANDGRI